METIPDNNTRILVVDDDVGLLLSIKTTLVSAGFPEPALVSDSRRVPELIEKHGFDLILLDLMMPHISGMEVLEQLKEKHPEIECLIITAVDEVSTAVTAMRYGAYDFLVKPLETDRLLITIERALERHDLRHKIDLMEKSASFSSLKNPDAFNALVAATESMARVFHQAEAYAPNDYNLLITGETGTGKEMLARVVHTLSNRSSRPFVAVNMGAFSQSLFEDEFFGHSKGAFTGASQDRKGFFEEAMGGTIFLDEITDLDFELQKKLLRVIEEREIYRLGSAQARSIDLRIISATNRDIQKETDKGRFRNDLYYRLNVCHIHIPPLRERKEDILPLAQHFSKIHSQKSQKNIQSLSADVTRYLLQHHFAGNVRELENMIATAVLNEKSRTLSLASLGKLHAREAVLRDRMDGILSLREMEKQHILQAVEAAGGNRTKAAHLLGIGLRTLQRKLKAFGSNQAL